MTIALVINGVTFPYPEQGDEDWGPTATDWAAAVTSGMLQKAGGAFTLTADVDFGASFGLKSLYYKTRTTNISDAGQFRLARADVISWRNQGNSANLDLAVNSSNELTFNGVAILPAGITSLTGDVTGTGPGAAATTIASNVVSNSKLAQMATATFKGRTTAGTGNAEDLTVTQATAMLNVMTGDSGAGGLKGLVPAQVAGDATKFLNGAGAWSNPAGAGDVTGPAGATANAICLFNSTTGKIIKDGGIGTTSQVLVGGTTPTFGSTPAASLPLATSSVRGAIVITSPTIQKFTSSSGTYTTPAGVAYIRVRMVGGGGGGGGGGATAGNGGTGGSTTFGSSLLTANGGVGGIYNTGSSSSSGGSATVSSPAIGFAISGSDNGAPSYMNPASGSNGMLSSDGASSPFGGAGRGAGGSNAIGTAAKVNSGSGGGGGYMASSGSTISGPGGAAGGYIDAIIGAPSASYAYAVGAAGAAGTAGTSGGAGYAGGSGFIVVEEFYY